jgi:hypothetical protein
MRFSVVAEVPRMSIELPDPPDSLAGAPQAFYDELRRMLTVAQPTQIDPRRTSVRFDRNGVEIELVHASGGDQTIWATVGDNDAIVGTSWARDPRPGRSDFDQRDAAECSATRRQVQK